MRDYRKERVGARRINNQGLWMEVIEYNSWDDIKVKFDDGVVVKALWRDFIKGFANNPNYPKGDSPKTERIGEENINNQGCKMKIVDYKNSNNITVQFDDNPNHLVNTQYMYFKEGKTHNPFAPTIYGVGILGDGSPSSKKEGAIKEYMAWKTMLERCYSPVRQEKCPTYKGCTVSDEFLYYPNFYNWLIGQENYMAWKNNPNFNVDKDIICKGNKIYSADKCCLVPNWINNAIKIGKRGDRLLGVRYDKKLDRYYAGCSNWYLGRRVALGGYETEYEAFLAYKEYKENLLKEIAEKEYKAGTISKECRDGLMRYQIEVTD